LFVAKEGHATGTRIILQNKKLDFPNIDLLSFDSCYSNVSDIQLSAITTKLSSKLYLHPVGFEVLTAVTMSNVVFWNLALCGPCKKQTVGNDLTFFLSGVYFSTPKIETTCSSETSVFTRSTRRHIQQDTLLMLKSHSDFLQELE
jgi:hypothetical protein